MGYELGIDVGTTFTAAAVLHGDRAELLGLGNRAMQVPSVLYVAEDGEVLVGEAAEQAGRTNADRLVREFKRRIGDPVPIIVAGSPRSPQAMLARVLEWVVATATTLEGEAPDTVRVTHPANWGPFKTQLLEQAVALAGLTSGPGPCPQVTFRSEPEAAAVAYASRHLTSPGDVVAVYDLGGGTFDVALLERTDDGFVLVGEPDGIEHLGGIDFDEAVFQHVLSALGPAMTGVDPADAHVVRALARLRRDCVEAKEALSASTEVEIAVSLPKLSTTVRLTRAELERMIEPALLDTVRTLRRTLGSAQVTDDRLTSIVLIGGSARIPRVSELLVAEFGCPVALDAHPKHDVAIGAVQPLPGSTASKPAALVVEPARSRALPRPRLALADRRRALAVAGAALLVAAGAPFLLSQAQPSLGPVPARPVATASSSGSSAAQAYRAARSPSTPGSPASPGVSDERSSTAPGPVLSTEARPHNASPLVRPTSAGPAPVGQRTTHPTVGTTPPPSGQSSPNPSGPTTDSPSPAITGSTPDPTLDEPNPGAAICRHAPGGC